MISQIHWRLCHMNVAELMTVPQFETLEVLAGKEGITKEISTVTMMDAPDIIQFLKPGELLVTTAYHVKDDEQSFIGDYKITDLGENPNILPKYYQVPPLMKEWMIRYRSKHQQQQHEPQKTCDEFKICFVYQDQKDLRKPDADLFWIANRLANDGEKSTVQFDGKFHFNQDYRKHCV